MRNVNYRLYCINDQPMEEGAHADTVWKRSVSAFVPPITRPCRH